MKWKLILFISLFFACRSTVVKIPKNIIQQEDMVSLLLDVHIADGMAINENVANVKLLNQIKKKYLESVLEKHQISKDAFEESMLFYENNPEELFTIYEKVMIEIATLEAQNEGKKIEEKTEQ